MTDSEQSKWVAHSQGGEEIEVSVAGRERVALRIDDSEPIILNAGHVEQLVFALDRAVTKAWPGDGRGSNVLPHALAGRA